MIPNMPALLRANTILYCRAWAATVAFYRHLLGLPVGFENDWFVEFRLNDGAYLSIADARRASIAAVAGQGITLAWQIPACLLYTSDAADARARVDLCGCRIILKKTKKSVLHEDWCH